MPITPCTRENKPGFKYGETGFCYVYEDNEASKEAARQAAIKQGQAIEISRSTEISQAKD